MGAPIAPLALAPTSGYLGTQLLQKLGTAFMCMQSWAPGSDMVRGSSNSKGKERSILGTKWRCLTSSKLDVTMTDNVLLFTDDYILASLFL